MCCALVCVCVCGGGGGGMCSMSVWGGGGLNYMGASKAPSVYKQMNEMSTRGLEG